MKHFGIDVKEFVKAVIVIAMIAMVFLAWTGLDVEIVDEDEITVPCARVLTNRDLFTPAEVEYCVKLANPAN